MLTPQTRWWSCLGGGGRAWEPREALEAPISAARAYLGARAEDSLRATTTIHHVFHSQSNIPLGDPQVRVHKLERVSVVSRPAGPGMIS